MVLNVLIGLIFFAATYYYYIEVWSKANEEKLEDLESKIQKTESTGLHSLVRDSKKLASEKSKLTNKVLESEKVLNEAKGQLNK